MAVALWKTLLKDVSGGADTSLTCDECFAILEYLADMAVAGADLEALRLAALHHLSRCPDCRRQHLRRLRELEAALLIEGTFRIE